MPWQVLAALPPLSFILQLPTQLRRTWCGRLLRVIGKHGQAATVVVPHITVRESRWLYAHKATSSGGFRALVQGLCCQLPAATGHHHH